MKNRVESIHYQEELEKYKRARINLKKEQYHYIEKEKRKQREVENSYFMKEENCDFDPVVVCKPRREKNIEPFERVFGNRPIFQDDIKSQELSFEEKIIELEARKMITFQEEYLMDEDVDFFDRECFLYHGLRYYDSNKRFEEGMKKLEGILKEEHILAGKYLEGYYPSLDNCNELEYVSLASYSDSIEFKIFVLENICLLIRPSSNAYQTIYVSYDMWEFMKKNQIELKNRYSYAHNEYQVKDSIPLTDVKAIGIPLFNIQLSEGIDIAKHYQQQVIDLLNQYDIDLPVVDTSCYNQVIYPRNHSKRLVK